MVRASSSSSSARLVPDVTFLVPEMSRESVNPLTRDPPRPNCRPNCIHSFLERKLPRAWRGRFNPALQAPVDFTVVAKCSVFGAFSSGFDHFR